MAKLYMCNKCVRMMRSHKVNDQAIPNVPHLPGEKNPHKQNKTKQSSWICYTYHFGIICIHWMSILDQSLEHTVLGEGDNLQDRSKFRENLTRKKYGLSETTNNSCTLKPSI